MLLARNEWSEQMVWPKVYVRIEDEQVAVYTEHTIDYERGVTDEQLDLQLTGGSAARWASSGLDESTPKRS